MDSRPVGIFDSGLGGLTTVRELRRLMPQENIVYFGDTGRVPYGTRSREIIRRYAVQDIRFLLSREVKMIVAACNTVAAALAGELDGWGVPVVEALTPAVRAARRATHTGRIGVSGTSATARSGAYDRALRELEPGLEVLTAPCPLFVPLVENGFAQRENPVTRMVAEQYLAPVRAFKPDVLILGCTHYPAIKDLLGELMGEGVTLIDSGQEAAREAQALLRTRGLEGGEGSCEYCVSDSPADFAENACAILGERIPAPAVKIDIEAF